MNERQSRHCPPRRYWLVRLYWAGGLSCSHGEAGRRKAMPTPALVSLTMMARRCHTLVTAVLSSATSATCSGCPTLGRRPPSLRNPPETLSSDSEQRTVTASSPGNRIRALYRALLRGHSRRSLRFVIICAIFAPETASAALSVLPDCYGKNRAQTRKYFRKRPRKGTAGIPEQNGCKDFRQFRQLGYQFTPARDWLP